MNHIHKLKITTYRAPYKIITEGEKPGIEVSPNTELYIKDEEQEVEIDDTKENLQLKIKEYVDDIAKYNKRQVRYTLDGGGNELISLKILQRQSS